MKPDRTVEEAADILWLLTDSGGYHRLVLERGWEPERYKQWLAESMIRLLLIDDTR